MLHIIHLHTPGCALQQDLARVQCQWDGAPKDHQGDESARRGVCVEALGEPGLPDDHGSDDDAYVVDGIANDVDEDPKHA